MAFSYKDYEQSDAVKQAKALADANSTYNESQSVVDARNALNQHTENKVADWTGGQYGQQLKDTVQKINDRQSFKYDVTGDALYQAYKDRYMTQGRMAMADTLGQASAMTGGYGSSYATTAASQAYQNSLQSLNDVVPSLYQMALDTYSAEGQDLQNRYSVLNNAYGTEYGEYRDQVADWQTEANRLQDAYYNESNNDWNRFSDNRNYYQSAYQYASNMDYDQYADAYANALSNYQFEQQMALDWAKFNASQASSGSGGSGGSGSSKSKSSSGSGITTTNAVGNNYPYSDSGLTSALVASNAAKSSGSNTAYAATTAQKLATLTGASLPSVDTSKKKK